METIGFWRERGHYQETVIGCCEVVPIFGFKAALVNLLRPRREGDCG